MKFAVFCGIFRRLNLLTKSANFLGIWLNFPSLQSWWNLPFFGEICHFFCDIMMKYAVFFFQSFDEIRRFLILLVKFVIFFSVFWWNQLFFVGFSWRNLLFLNGLLTIWAMNLSFLPVIYWKYSDVFSGFFDDFFSFLDHAQTCPKGWVDFKDSCYKFTRAPLKTRDEADEICRAYNADLAAVNNLEEHYFIVNWLRENDPQHRR